MGLRIIDVAGTPAEMGAAHGRAVGRGLLGFARERLALAADGTWTGRPLDEARVLELAEACVRAHRAYSPALSDELAALADAAGLTMAEAVVANGFTDFADTVYAAAADRPTVGSAASVDDCTAFLVPPALSADGHGLFGQTWDMHASAEEHVIVLRARPDDAPAFVAFTTAGCVGMIGMNEHGITIGINNLSGGDGRVGVTWPFVVRQALRQRDLGAALRCVTEAPLAGAHNYLLMDAEGAGFNVEATSTRNVVTELDREALVHANNCMHPDTQAVQRPRDPTLLASSEARAARGAQLLAGGALTPEDVMAATADEVAICYGPGRHGPFATCGAVVARPGTRDFWAVAGRPSERPFERVPLPG